ncbi:hypothetical protein F5883DRAFT_576357 [Diaporthe sp. PMI_573]|jgi:hypothetical protein|nr:hypothetical protein F5883DRAFT_576357 [Diaporthaceae sp. PMI_573]
MAKLKDLPVEIRSAIWAEALSDEDAEVVYVFDPEDFGIKDEDEDEDESEGEQAESDWEVELEVIVAFPTIMHLCHESREYAKSQLSFREDTVIGVHIPCRPYRPGTDAFFVHHRHFDKFLRAFRKAQDDEFNGKLQEGEKAFCGEIWRLALSSQMLMEDDIGDTLSYLVPDMTALRHLGFVFDDIDGLDLTRPLRLSEWAEDRAEIVPGKPRTRIHVKDTLDNIMDQTAFWEVSDRATAPWDEWTGEWLFNLEASEIIQVCGYV